MMELGRDDGGFQGATNEDEKSDTTNEKMGFVVSHLRKGRS
jgi:hypothetical protein